jgi:cobalt-zinc-cadmium resistance protein CzcA
VAIDFGLIVDGAVIIVEATLHYLTVRKINSKLSQQQMDEAVEGKRQKNDELGSIRSNNYLHCLFTHSFITGCGRKNVSPMAETVGFAILGALLLSLSYIPMMSALFLSKNTSHKKIFQTE